MASRSGPRATRDEGHMGLRGGGFRRAVREGRPAAEVGEKRFEDRGLVNDRDDQHHSPTLGTAQRIDLIHVCGGVGPARLERPGWRAGPQRGPSGLDWRLAPTGLPACPCGGAADFASNCASSQARRAVAPRKLAAGLCLSWPRARTRAGPAHRIAGLPFQGFGTISVAEF